MSHNRNRDRDSNSSGWIAGLVGAGIGLLAGFIISKIASNDSKKQASKVNNDIETQFARQKQLNQPSKVMSGDTNFEDTLLCPISLQIMKDPVTIPECGHCFERQMITSILNKTSKCPLCRKNTNVSTLVPNYQLKNVIDHYKETRK